MLVPFRNSVWHILEVASYCTLFALGIFGFHTHTPGVDEWASSISKVTGYIYVHVTANYLSICRGKCTI